MEFAEREAAVSNILRDKSDLYAVYIGCSERIIKALFLMNSGGVVTLLAYLHNALMMAADIERLWWLSVSLRLFLLGLVCAFILVASDYLVVYLRFSHYVKQSREFLDDKICFSKIDWFQGKPDSLLRKIFFCIFVNITGFISFVCAIMGIVVGLYGYHLI